MGIVLDTNVFVAAGFNRESYSAQIVELIRSGQLLMYWDEDTRAETESVLERIPPLAWKRFEELFKPEYRVPRAEPPADFRGIEDPTDRKFAQLAERAGAVLVSNDDHLLAARDSLAISICSPREYMERHLSFS